MSDKILRNFNITALNKMQLATIEAAKTSKNILLLSPTGSGKTLAFLIPVMNALKTNKVGVQAMIIVPSRELAMQIEQVFKQMSTGFKITCVYGGHPTKIEKNSLVESPAVLVGTPGRIAYHLRQQNFDKDTVHTLVLDEFDKSLEFGFKVEMESIIASLSKLWRTILTSATNMKEIPDFSGVKKPVVLNFLNNSSPTTAELQLKYIKSADIDKLHELFLLICTLENKPTIVFCNHREAVDRVSALLKEKRLAHGVFHGGMEQEDREKALIKFRNGSHPMLITTDLASRGLDIPEIQNVVHYQLPPGLEVFTHRNGRTARMNATGTAYLLLTANEFLPSFVPGEPEQVTLARKVKLPARAPWRTLYIGSGKKDKINKMDIVGMLLQKGGLQKDELGLVEVLDRTSYAAVSSDKIVALLELIRHEKVKGKKVKIEISD
jgi:superfamily II DNA/RNA helicase